MPKIGNHQNLSSLLKDKKILKFELRHFSETHRTIFAATAAGLMRSDWRFGVTGHR